MDGPVGTCGAPIEGRGADEGVDADEEDVNGEEGEEDLTRRGEDEDEGDVVGSESWRCDMVSRRVRSATVG